MKQLSEGSGREIVKVGRPSATPKEGGLQALVRRLGDAVRVLLGRNEASTSSADDPRLQPYPGISTEFEAGIKRILQARTETGGRIDISGSHQLARDVARLLIGLVKKWKTVSQMARRSHGSDQFAAIQRHLVDSDDGEELLLMLKTIVMEKTREVFDEETRRQFMGQLDHALLIESVHSR